MKRLKQAGALLLSLAMITSLTACSSTGSSDSSSDTSDASGTEFQTTTTSYDVTNPDDMSSLIFDSSAWNYDADNDVYWQIGVSYCANPEAEDYESLGIYVPGAYMDATDNGAGTYTCTINTENSVGSYTADTAPIVMPINTAGYSAQEAPTSYSYSGLSEYLEAGYIYVYAGCRGRSNGENSDGSTYSGGAPWGVTDLKAAVRYLRYNEALLPGNTDSIFTFGHSGGGAQSSLMGSTGDSSLYYEYLESIGAVMLDDNGNYISDAIAGAMCWCPITSLDVADEAYEWMMGQYSDSGTRADDTWTSALSDDMAAAFATYINELGLTDEDGNILTLDATDDGIYTSGTYYDYVLSVIEESLNNFLSDTEFPYTSGSTEMADGGFAGGGDTSSGDGAPSGDAPSGDAPSGDMPSGDAPSDGAPSGDMPSGDGAPSGDMPSGDGAPSGDGVNSDSSSETYETAADYIASLNSDVEWITYDEATNTASITSIEAFVEHCKTATKDVGAFDDLNRSQAENMVFGNSEEDALHFDFTMASLLAENADEYAAYSDYDASFIAAYEEDLQNTDALGNDSQTRQNMYNPLYYISSSYDGYGTSTLAKYWRINTGITQGDTSLTTELNLALALESCDSVESVDFTTVWGQGHTTAERTGDSTTNFIEWVNDCLAQ